MSAPSHPRQLELERLAVGEPSPAHAHVADCAECAAQVNELKHRTQSFAARRPAPLFLAALARRRQPWWKQRWLALALLPLVALLALFMWGPEPVETRLKGGGLQIALTRGAQTRPMSGSDRPRGGDRLTFDFDARVDGYLILLDVEPGKAPTAFFPFRGSGSAQVTAGPHTLCDGVLLDDTKNDEWLLSVFSPRALSVEEIAATLDGGVPSFTCAGCQVEVRVLSREVR